MLLFLLATLSAPTMPVQTPDTDTTVAVPAGTRLVLHTPGGLIQVRAWAQDRVRVQAEHSSRVSIDLIQDGAVLEVKARGRIGPAGVVDYMVTVPTWMALDLGGLGAEVDVSGTTAEVIAQTLQGDITVRGGNDVTLTSTQGRLRLLNSRGRATLHTVADDIEVENLSGDLVAETVGGEIGIVGGTVGSVDAQTIGGDVTYRGNISPGGRYVMTTHGGEILVTVPPTISARVSAASVMGDFSTNFTVNGTRTSGKRHTFRLGNGSAVIELETFGGDIRLMRQAP